MSNQPKDFVAQAVYLAQLQAAKGSCKCKCCELLRRATDAMTDSLLAGDNPGTGSPADAMKIAREVIGENVEV